MRHQQALRRGAGQRRRVDLTVAAGTVHGIVGENGAGKSTLMSVLYGLYTRRQRHASRSSASRRRSATPHEAIALGIGMVHQHFMLVDTLSALDNVMLGAEPHALLHARRAQVRAAARRADAVHRPGGGAGRDGGRPAGGRPAAPGDPEGAGPRREDPDPRRAHRGADAAGDRAAVRGAGAAARAGHDDPADHAQAQGGHAPVRPRHGDARRPRGARDGAWPTPRSRRWPRRWSGARCTSAARATPASAAGRGAAAARRAWCGAMRWA